MQFIMSDTFNLIENFIDIVNNKCCLIMCAKYYNSNMNDACTVYLADIVGPPKVVQPTAFFSKKKMIFIWFLCQPLAT